MVFSILPRVVSILSILKINIPGKGTLVNTWLIGPNTSVFLQLLPVVMHLTMGAV